MKDARQVGKTWPSRRSLVERILELAGDSTNNEQIYTECPTRDPRFPVQRPLSYRVFALHQISSLYMYEELFSTEQHFWRFHFFATFYYSIPRHICDTSRIAADWPSLWRLFSVVLARLIQRWPVVFFRLFFLALQDETWGELRTIQQTLAGTISPMFYDRATVFSLFPPSPPPIPFAVRLQLWHFNNFISVEYAC